MKNTLKPSLWLLLVVICSLLWLKWDAANAPKLTMSQQVEQNENIAGAPGEFTKAALQSPSQQAQSETTVVTNKTGGKITVKTDVLEITIDLLGGTVVNSELLDYSVSIDDKKPIKLFNSEPSKLFHLQSGLNSNHQQNATHHQALFSSIKTDYVLDGESIAVPLVWQADGVTVTKTFTFYKGRYDFDLDQTVKNDSAETWEGYAYHQLKRKEVIVEAGLTTFNTFAGAAYSEPESLYNKLSFHDMAERSLDLKGITGGWEAMIEHYFMGAIIPEQESKNTFYTQSFPNEVFSIGMYSQTQQILPGQSKTFAITGFVGPKIKNDLQRIAPSLDKATDYGFLFFISEFLFNVLDAVHKIVKNWGWAIVIVTLGIKLILFPLAAKSFKSMAKMRKFQPDVERIRENYKDDRQLLGKKMMELYKKEGINPASGCLPILIQIPIFLAFYYMLMESVELRQAPWIFWIKDLSIQDPYYVLPIVNMVLMYFQQKLNPPPSDPVQRKVLMFLPLIFGILFLFFPAGLVLYWVVSNLFSIVQQYVITKRYGGLSNK